MRRTVLVVDVGMMMMIVLLAAVVIDVVNGTSISSSAGSASYTSLLRHQRRNSSNDNDKLDHDSSEIKNSYVNTYDPFKEKEDTLLALPFGEINIVVVTDVHSWISGNHQDSPYHWPYDKSRLSFSNIDYGDLLSFYRHLETIIDDNFNSQSDIYFVMNGDFVDGTGLSSVPPIHLTPLLERMPFNAINVGNHELYLNSTIEFLTMDGATEGINNKSSTSNTSSFINSWKGNYLSSNTILLSAATGGKSQSLGNRYTYLHGKNTNTTILIFGFLFNMKNYSSLVKVQKVQNVIKQQWFIDVLTPNKSGAKHYDGIVVLAHMDCLDPLVKIILDRIRSILIGNTNEQIPIQFITGHTHRRCHVQLDENSASFEAGRFLDTLGFVSFSTSSSSITTENLESSSSFNFQHRFIDPDRKILYNTLVASSSSSSSSSSLASLSSRRRQGRQQLDNKNDNYDFSTLEGRELTKAIQKTEDKLGLKEVIGCASIHTYELFDDCTTADHRLLKPINPNSLWYLYLNKVLPVMVLKPQQQQQQQQQQQHYEDDEEEEQPQPELIFIAGTGTLRYSLFKGLITFDDIIATCPFNDTIVELIAEIKEQEQEKQIQSIIPTEIPFFYGKQLIEIVNKANELYSYDAFSRMLAFEISAITTTTTTTTTTTDSDSDRDGDDRDGDGSRIRIDPNRRYRMFTTGYDHERIVSTLMILQQQPKQQQKMNNSAAAAVSSSVPFYRSKQICRNSRSHSRNSNNNTDSVDDDCLYLTELWKQYIIQHMPVSECHQHQDNHDRDDDPSSSSSLSLSSLSAATATAQLHHGIRPPISSSLWSSSSSLSSQRMTTPELIIIKQTHQQQRQQKSGLLILIGMSISMIAFLLIFPHQHQQEDRNNITIVGRRRGGVLLVRTPPPPPPSAPSIISTASRTGRGPNNSNNKNYCNNEEEDNEEEVIQLIQLNNGSTTTSATVTATPTTSCNSSSSSITGNDRSYQSYGSI